MECRIIFAGRGSVLGAVAYSFVMVWHFLDSRRGIQDWLCYFIFTCTASQGGITSLETGFGYRFERTKMIFGFLPTILIHLWGDFRPAHSSLFVSTIWKLRTSNNPNLGR